MKEVIKIVLLKQIILPVISMFLLVLFLPKGVVFAASQDLLSSEALTNIFVFTIIGVVFGIWFIWLPITCISIWNKSKCISVGWQSKLAKAYSSIIFLLIVVPGGYMLPQIPEIYSELKSHNNSSEKGAQNPRGPLWP
ncbi:MAG: hypothetical protein HRU20_17285 [Pseudomonadales bacterium]|nr:hypothetical protein [Pseudomonadales bacterium]